MISEQIGALAPIGGRGEMPTMRPPRALPRSLLRALVRGAHRHVWLIVAIAVAVTGTLAAFVGASTRARSDRAEEVLSFHLASSDIASRLRLAIQHEEDLVLSASAFVASEPYAPNAAFERWSEAVRPLPRYPELQAIGLVEPVPAARIAGFAASGAAHGITVAGASRSRSPAPFAIYPPGRRAYYCFAVAGEARSAAVAIPPGYDFCEGGPTLLQTRDSGAAAYLPFSLGGVSALAVETPVYRAKLPLGTVAERRRAFVGWLGEALVPTVVVMRATAGHQHVGVTLRFKNSEQISFTGGASAAGAERYAIGLHNGWTVQTSQRLRPGGLLHDRDALALLVGGILMSIAIGLLLLMLTTSRSRALRLVEAQTLELSEKNRELSHLALHDPLTGLPNRALALERARQLLARVARSPDHVAAALFIDLDGFKGVNDTLGHAAGDELLKAVATRLETIVRDEDTVGRLGGDEFVVLAEATLGAQTARMLAERLSAEVRKPVLLDDGQVIDIVTASIGIAEGAYASPDALLRDADVALYAAKAGGKDRYAVFVSGATEPRSL